MQQYAIGIDIGGTNIKAALVARYEGLVHHISTPTEADEGPVHVLNRLVEVVQAMIAQAPGRQVNGVGIGAPGAINWERTTLIQPPNIPDWGTINLSEMLRRRIDPELTVIVENDANVAGLGSAHYGAGQPHDSFIMITLGTGVGGAIIYRNTIFRGSTGAAGEIGHMTIDYEGPLDNAGVAGSIESYLGQQFLTRHARFRLINYPESVLHEEAGPDLEDLNPALIHDAAQRGDEGARDILAWAGHKLGCVLGAVVNLLDIRTIIVGGGVSAAGDYILEPARQTVPHYIMPGMRDHVQIIRETLGNEVGMLGAAYLIFEYMDAHVPSSERA